MEPRDIPADVIKPLYTAVGHIVVNWAFVEQSLDMWIAIIYQTSDDRCIEDVIPMALGRKIRFLRKCFNRMHVLANFRAEALDYIAKAKELSDTRHFIIHDTISKYNPTDHTFTFVKLDVVDGGTFHQLSKLVIMGQKLLDDGIRCQILTSDMLKLGERLESHLVT
jgi:hypothetical protein